MIWRLKIKNKILNHKYGPHGVQNIYFIDFFIVHIYRLSQIFLYKSVSSNSCNLNKVSKGNMLHIHLEVSLHQPDQNLGIHNNLSKMSIYPTYDIPSLKFCKFLFDQVISFHLHLTMFYSPFINDIQRYSLVLTLSFSSFCVCGIWNGYPIRSV